MKRLVKLQIVLVGSGVGAFVQLLMEQRCCDLKGAASAAAQDAGVRFCDPDRAGPIGPCQGRIGLAQTNGALLEDAILIFRLVQLLDKLSIGALNPHLCVAPIKAFLYVVCHAILRFSKERDPCRSE